ncbi:MAG: hypothetical protein SNJ54_10505 [Anaerolineae bacterium]
MTIHQILEQARALSPHERRELAKQLLDMINELEPAPAPTASDHWGQSLNKLLDEVGSIPLRYPEIEDPVAWVKHTRSKRQRQQLRSDDAE